MFWEDAWRVIAERGQSSDMRLMTDVRGDVMRDLGLQAAPKNVSELVRENDTDLTLTYVEAIHRRLVLWFQDDLAKKFADRVNEVLLAYRLKFRFVPDDSEIVPLDSMELHISVVEPALALLHGEPEFADAHGSYLKALKEISENEPANAITDAGTALQQILVTLGCQGNALGPLIKDAKTRGLFAGHDNRLVAGITNFMEWVSADRSEKGDAHKPGTEDLNDAWLMVHIVGALIVHLAEESPRA